MSARLTCEAGGKKCTVILDTGSTINIITERAASEISGKVIHLEKPVRTVGARLVLTEAVIFKLKIGKITEISTAHIVPEAPAEILLGTQFLMKYSKGFKLMMQEFVVQDASNHVEAIISCTILTEREELEGLLIKYKGLVLEKGELPGPDRYYKRQTFSLGLPEDKRRKRYYKAQYPPNPQDIERYKKILIPLLHTGVYRISSSPHNNPTMLVPKKNPGDFRLVVDGREVNKECEPKGALCTSPLKLIKAMEGAKIFTTLDCKNAFYSLVLDERDR